MPSPNDPNYGPQQPLASPYNLGAAVIPQPDPPAPGAGPPDPPIFLLNGSPTFAPWLGDTQYQRVQIGATGQVLAVQPDGSVNWQSVAGVPVAPSNDTTGAADLTAINAALAAGQAVALQPGATYYVNNSITPMSGNVLDGGHGAIGIAASPPRIVATAGFSGTGIIELGTTAEVQIRNLCLDGSLITSGTHYGINGVSATYAKLLDLLILGDVNKVNTGLVNGVRQNSSGANPVGWHVERVIIRYASGSAFNLVNGTDATWIDCQSSTSGADGWIINGCQNSRWVGCRGDRDTNAGFHVTGSGWGTGSGSGGASFVGISSDRCGQNGTLVDATGTGPLLFVNSMHRRDGSDGNAARAGMRINACTNPVIVTGISVFPGVEDNGSGNNTPPNGLSITGANSSVTVESGYVQGVTTAINYDGAAAHNYIGAAIVQATGTTAAPTITGGYTAQTQAITSTPTAPASTTSATLVMMGLGTNATGTPWVVTCTSTGRCLVTVQGQVTTATAAVQLTYGARFGTGTAPVNGAAVTGTRFGTAGDPTVIPSAIGNRSTVTFSAVLQLTPGTATWFDLALATSNAADAASVNNVAWTVVELQ